MKRFGITALVLALGTTLMAAPQGDTKAPTKGKTAPTTTTTDTNAPVGKSGKAGKGGAKAKAKAKKGAKQKASDEKAK